MICFTGETLCLQPLEIGAESVVAIFSACYSVPAPASQRALAFFASRSSLVGGSFLLASVIHDHQRFVTLKVPNHSGLEVSKEGQAINRGGMLIRSWALGKEVQQDFAGLLKLLLGQRFPHLP